MLLALTAKGTKNGVKNTISVYNGPAFSLCFIHFISHEVDGRGVLIPAKTIGWETLSLVSFGKKALASLKARGWGIFHISTILLFSLPLSLLEMTRLKY